jgi:hypothetical protein
MLTGLLTGVLLTLILQVGISLLAINRIWRSLSTLQKRDVLTQCVRRYIEWTCRRADFKTGKSMSMFTLQREIKTTEGGDKIASENPPRAEVVCRLHEIFPKEEGREEETMLAFVIGIDVSKREVFSFSLIEPVDALVDYDQEAREIVLISTFGPQRPLDEGLVDTRTYPLRDFRRLASRVRGEFRSFERVK